MVSFIAPDFLESKPSVEAIRSLILQTHRQANALVILMSGCDHVSQNPGPEPTTLVTRVDLNLLDLDFVVAFEELDHAYGPTTDQDERNAAHP